MPPFDRDTTTDQVLEGVDLSGKHIVITGASSGLGEESARALASKGASITMLARDREKNEAAAARIRERVPGADLELRELELGNLAGIRAFAKEFLAERDRIDVLLDNAGVMACPYATTDDGFELQLGSNHLGHFLLTLQLWPALVRASSPRVVALSSGGHGISDIDYDDPMFERREYDPWIAYGQSKTANALFALELDGRLKPHGGAAYSVHPGMIMTSLGRHLTPDLMAAMQKRITDRVRAEGKEPPSDPAALFKTVEAGAATQVWAATTTELADHGGAYLANCRVGEPGGNVGEHGVERYATDRASAARLWSLSEEWVGERLDA